MPLANLKEFRAAGYKPEHTGVCKLWVKSINDDIEVMIYATPRCELDDARPMVDEWSSEQCEVQIFSCEQLMTIDSVLQDSALEAIAWAEQYIASSPPKGRER
jgi:hypothetical protein